VIDPSYTGSIKIIIKHAVYADLARYLPGNVVGQLILRPHLTATFEQVDTLQETERGDGGFGSTANK
jgi:dUTP pyrophosphatase